MQIATRASAQAEEDFEQQQQAGNNAQPVVVQPRIEVIEVTDKVEKGSGPQRIEIVDVDGESGDEDEGPFIQVVSQGDANEAI